MSSCFNYAIIIKLSSFSNRYTLYTFDDRNQLKAFKISNAKTMYVKYDKETDEVSPVMGQMLILEKYKTYHNYLYAI